MSMRYKTIRELPCLPWNMTWDFEFHGRLVWDCTSSSRRVVSFHFKRRGASVAARERRSRSVRAYRGGEFSTRFLRSRRRSFGERWAIQGLWSWCNGDRSSSEYMIDAASVSYGERRAVGKVWSRIFIDTSVNFDVYHRLLGRRVSVISSSTSGVRVKKTLTCTSIAMIKTSRWAVVVQRTGRRRTVLFVRNKVTNVTVYI